MQFTSNMKRQSRVQLIANKNRKNGIRLSTGALEGSLHFCWPRCGSQKQLSFGPHMGVKDVLDLSHICITFV